MTLGHRFISASHGSPDAAEKKPDLRRIGLCDKSCIAYLLDARIWPRISPPGFNGVLCTFAYATPARIAAITSSSSPAVICWLVVLALMTFAAVICPVTVPDCGQNGVSPATA